MPAKRQRLHRDLIEARRSPRHGLGVFARAPIAAGAVIERCPVLLIAPDDVDCLGSGSLSGHIYDWGGGYAAIALGYGSLYNHDAEPNADYAAHEDSREIVIAARRDIEAGEEILIDYTGDGEIELWFDP